MYYESLICLIDSSTPISSPKWTKMVIPETSLIGALVRIYAWTQFVGQLRLLKERRETKLGDLDTKQRYPQLIFAQNHGSIFIDLTA